MAVGPRFCGHDRRCFCCCYCRIVDDPTQKGELVAMMSSVCGSASGSQVCNIILYCSSWHGVHAETLHRAIPVRRLGSRENGILGVVDQQVGPYVVRFFASDRNRVDCTADVSSLGTRVVRQRFPFGWTETSVRFRWRRWTGLLVACDRRLRRRASRETRFWWWLAQIIRRWQWRRGGPGG